MRNKTSDGSRSPYLLEALEKRKLLASGIGSFVPRTAAWSLRSTASAGPADVATFQFGAKLPVVGDWNGDGRDDIGTFNPSTATWSLRYGASAGTPDAGVFVFGQRGTLPVVGDWNGDGRDDIGVYNPNKAEWSLRLGASAGPANAGTFRFGAKYALPVAGDWNGDGKDGIGTFDPARATWTLRQTASAGSADAGTFNFGSRNTLPVVGDWNGDNKDGIAAVTPRTATWTVRQTASAGAADVGTFVFGPINSIPVAGDFKGPTPTPPPVPTPTGNVLTSVTLKPLDLDLLGLEVQTSPITITITSKSGDGKLVGNLLNSVSNILNTTDATNAMNNVLAKAVDLVNSTDLSLAGIAPGAFDTATASTTQVLELFVAPTHLDTLGVQIDMSPVRLSVSAHAGSGLVLGNALMMLSNLFNPPLPESLDIDVINANLSNVLGQLNAQLGSIAAADVPTVPSSAGNVLTLAVPAIDVNLLGMVLQTDPVIFDASAQEGNGQLLGNVWTTALSDRSATPEELAQMSNTANAVLAKVFGALNSSSLTLPPAAISALSPAMQALLAPNLFSPAGSSAPILDFALSSPASAPATVNLLGLSVASNNVNAQLHAVTGDGQVLGNLLYNTANLTNPGGPASLISLMRQLASNSTSSVGPITGYLSPVPTSSKQLFTLTLPPLDLNLLGLEVHTDEITVKLTAQSGNGDLLGNVLRGYTSLLNLSGLSGAVNNVLATVANLANSADLSLGGGVIGSGVFDTAPTATTQILDATVAPVHIDLTGAQVDTSPIHLTLIAHSGDGLVLGNVLTSLANLFNPPLPGQVDTSVINAQLQQMLSNLNAQVPSIAPAQVPAQTIDPSNVLGVTVPGLNLDLLGLGLKTDAIVVNAAAHTGNGNVLGNVYSTMLNTMGTTPSALGGVSGNVSALLAKVVGVFNAGALSLPASVLTALPPAYQTLANPTLINPAAGATMSFLDLGIMSPTGTNPPTSAGVLGLNGATSSIHLGMSSRTGDGLILGNMLYNVSNLLNPGSSSNFLYLLDLLA
ncbi:MAG: hypothetical protein QOF78_3639 [Phycisphaerales bacterium]|jgi:hypothetical protein|nr:hypothetical protein [Phycisphaerales bacterium]